MTVEENSRTTTNRQEKTKMYEDVFEKRGHDEYSVPEQETVRHKCTLQLPK